MTTCRYGGPTVMQMHEHPNPELRGPKDVVVKVHAAALNPVQYLIDYCLSTALLLTDDTMLLMMMMMTMSTD